MNSFGELGTVFFSKQTLPDIFACLILSAVRKEVCRAGYSCCGMEGIMQLSRAAGDE